MSFDQVWLQQQFPDVTGLAQIGRGGQKWVFGGTHSTEGDVVLKLFHPAANPERAFREVQAAQNVQCPRIPRVLGIGNVASMIGPLIWVREQRIRGEELRACVLRGPLDATSLLRLALHALEALAAAEQVRIVHRDVKPDNIISATDGSYWLLDFGLARHLDLDSLTATAAQFGVGTAGYTASEQFRNQKDDIDARADLFSLGVTLYECATGANPFRQGTADGREMQRRIETYALPSITRRVEVANQFRDLVLAMTRIRREQRLPTAAEALTWIREICCRENIS
jgi:eukaryotic-like serine/threonine-protein kinase